MVGGIYEKEDDIDGMLGFSILCALVCLGAFVAPYLVGYLGPRDQFI